MCPFIVGRIGADVWCRSQMAFQEQNIIPSVKHGGNVLVWSCFTAPGTGQLAVTDPTMSSASYQRVLEDNVRPSGQKLKLNWKWTFQQDNDSLHTSKSTKKCVKEEETADLWKGQVI